MNPPTKVVKVCVAGPLEDTTRLGDALSSPQFLVAAYSKKDSFRETDAVLVIVDVADLRQGLGLALELRRFEAPMVVILNRLEQAKVKVYPELLSRLLAARVISLRNFSQQHIEKIREEIYRAIHEGQRKESVSRSLSDILRHCAVPIASKQSALANHFDRILTHPILGTFFFMLIMTVLFQAIFLLGTNPMNWTVHALNVLAESVSYVVAEGMFRSLLVDGIIGGAGSVLAFMPQIAVLFFFISVLERTGYLPRAARLMDRIMRKFGLPGYSFIPLLNSLACAVPGIVSTRIIPSKHSRLKTILIAPLMGCSALLPVYTLLIAALIPEHQFFPYVSLQGLILLGLYLLGVGAAVLVSLVLKHALGQKDAGYVEIEIPGFMRPSIGTILHDVYEKLYDFLKGTGKIILICSLLIWFLGSFPRPSLEMPASERLGQSYAGRLGGLIEPLLRPIGYNKEESVALIMSFARREAFVSTLATVYNLQSGRNASASLVSVLREKHLRGEFSLATGLSLLIFFAFACQCSSTLAACKRETGSWFWTGVLFCYTFCLAYVGAWVVYHAASAF